MDNLNLNPDNFKKWMKNQGQFEGKMEQKSVVGQLAETRFRASRISKHIVLEDGRLQKVVNDFVENGGVVKEIDGDSYLIEVKCGSFTIDKRYVIV